MLLVQSLQLKKTATNGEAFSFSAPRYIQGDAVSTSAPTVGTVGNFSSSQTSYTAGTSRRPWQVLSQLTVVSQSRLVELVATAVGQFVSEITVID